MIAGAHQASIQALINEAWATTPPEGATRKSPCAGAHMWRWRVGYGAGARYYPKAYDDAKGEWDWVPMPIGGGEPGRAIFAKMRLVDVSRPYRLRDDGLIEWLWARPWGDGGWHILDTCPSSAQPGRHLCTICEAKQRHENERFAEWKAKNRPNEDAALGIKGTRGKRGF